VVETKDIKEILLAILEQLDAIRRRVASEDIKSYKKLARTERLLRGTVLNEPINDGTGGME